MVIGLVQVEFKSDNTKFPLITVLFAIFEEPNITSKSKSSVSLVEFCDDDSMQSMELDGAVPSWSFRMLGSKIAR